MCAPTRDLAKIATVAALAYASGGSSVFATSTATAAEAGAAMYTDYAVSSGINWSGMFSTLSSVAKVATPILGAAGTIYQGVVNANLLKSKANFVDFSVGMDMEASALREIKRQRALANAIGTQRARYGITGVSLEGTPTDILEETSAKFAEDQYIDDFNTSQKIYSKTMSAEGLRQEAQATQLGGVVNAAVILGGRGFTPSNPVAKKSLLDGAGSYSQYASEPTAWSGSF